MENIDTIFVDGSTYQQAEELAVYIAKVSGSANPQQDALVHEIKSHESSLASDSLTLILVKHADALAKAPTKEYEAVFNQLFFIIRASSPDIISETVPSVINSILAGGAESVIPKLKVLTNLFNILDVRSPLRANVLVTLINLAASSGYLSAVQSQLDKVASWTNIWGLSPADKANLYLCISKALQTESTAAQSLDYLIKALRASQDDSSRSMGSLKAEAIRAVASTLTSPKLYHFEQLAALAPVRALAGEKIHMLLEVFLQGDLAQLQVFLQQNAGLVQEYKLDEAALLSKMRHIVLTQLGARHVAQKLSYSDIATALSIPVEDVELWVIDVIRAGLIQAKIDQMASTVHVNRTTYLTFGQQQWAEVRAKLSEWDESLSEVLQVIGNAKLIAQQQAHSAASVSVQSKN
ncbi:hypothetical protein H4R35_005776 [Dimargaris xerosporica]|nr:hypothetical protein H4R35_005776 [Dimargaris xerosporica]